MPKIQPRKIPKNISLSCSVRSKEKPYRPISKELVYAIWDISGKVTRGNEDIRVEVAIELCKYFENRKWSFKDIWYQARHRKGSHMRNLSAQVNNFITPEADIIYEQIRADYTNNRKFYRYERLLRLHGGVIEPIEKNDDW